MVLVVLIVLVELEPHPAKIVSHTAAKAIASQRTFIRK
jgi:hypothetical protein